MLLDANPRCVESSVSENSEVGVPTHPATVLPQMSVLVTPMVVAEIILLWLLTKVELSAFTVVPTTV